MARRDKVATWLDVDGEPELTPAGVRLLDAASGLFYEHGLRSVGVDTIAETANTTKKTLYDIFGSKDMLVALYLHRRSVRWRRFLAARLADQPQRLRSALAVFDAVEDWHGDSQRGCAFVNAYAEIESQAHPAMAVIRADKAWMRDLFVRLCGDLDAVEGRSSGAALHLIYEGALVLHAAGGRADALQEARRAAEAVLDAAEGRP